MEQEGDQTKQDSIQIQQLDAHSTSFDRHASLARLVSTRSTRRGLHTNIERMRYVNEHLYRWCKPDRPHKTLYVGVGHGLDALLALQDGLTAQIIGVDPYFDAAGNDSKDLDHLMAVTNTLGLQNQFTVAQMTIQDYLLRHDTQFDLIIINEVLHHIYKTDDLLRQSRHMGQTVDLFRRLRATSNCAGSLVIGDAERHGLRQMFTNVGLLKSSIRYGTKQPREEWSSAAIEGGWELANQMNYIPWAFRNQAWMWSGRLGRHTLCDKYILHFTPGDA